jgi:hypothetical protein
MQTPMVGSWSVAVKAVKPFTIHGDLYYELHVTRLDDPTNHLLAIRVPRHAVSHPPEAGQSLTVMFLMGQVTGTKPISGAD